MTNDVSRFTLYASRLKGLVILAVVAALWEVLPRTGIIDPVLLPPLSRVLARGVELLLSGVLVQHATASLWRVLLGFSLAIVVAMPLGIVLGLWPAVEDFVDLGLQLLRPLSPPAWIPLAILWFGIGNPPAIFIIFIGTVFAVLVGVAAATRGVDRSLVEVALTEGANQWQAVRHVVVPALMPALFAQVRVGLGLAWMSVIAAEMVAVHQGLGYMMIDARSLFRVDDVLVGMMAVGALGLAMDAVLRVAESRVLAWREGTTARELFAATRMR
ncbi:MAG: ABC transporter permease [Chloroflexi bacterium]|nr:ABC transporter permease [Chloroflexota bacterium]MBU1749224.1 ABC transporter permease [Chloroflexota bacterium]